MFLFFFTLRNETVPKLTFLYYKVMSIHLCMVLMRFNHETLKMKNKKKRNLCRKIVRKRSPSTSTPSASHQRRVQSPSFLSLQRLCFFRSRLWNSPSFVVIQLWHPRLCLFLQLRLSVAEPDSRLHERNSSLGVAGLPSVWS